MSDSRKETREYFEKCGLTYNDITQARFYLLMSLVAQEIEIANANNETNIDDYRFLAKTDIFFVDETLVYGFLYVGGSYFDERECISFNKDGFIGFAGWASDNNVKPILRAFRKWCDEIKESEGK